APPTSTGRARLQLQHGQSDQRDQGGGNTATGGGEEKCQCNREHGGGYPTRLKDHSLDDESRFLARGPCEGKDMPNAIEEGRDCGQKRQAGECCEGVPVDEGRCQSIRIGCEKPAEDPVRTTEINKETIDRVEAPNGDDGVARLARAVGVFCYLQGKPEDGAISDEVCECRESCRRIDADARREIAAKRSGGLRQETVAPARIVLNREGGRQPLQDDPYEDRQKERARADEFLAGDLR